MANSTDFQVTFFGASAWAAATHGKNSKPSTAPSTRGLAKPANFTFQNRISATACPIPTTRNPPLTGLFSFLASSGTPLRSVRQVPHSGIRSALVGEPHLFQQFNITWVSAQASHERIGFKFRDAGISLLKSAVQPLERLVGFLAVGVHLRDLIRAVVLMGGDKFIQGL